MGNWYFYETKIIGIAVRKAVDQWESCGEEKVS